MHALTSRLLLPAAIVFSLAVFLAARALGGNLELAVAVPAALVLALAAWLERRTPFRADWLRARGDLRTDLTSAALLLALVDPALKWLLPVAAIALAGMAVVPASAAFPASWPFAAQVMLATLLAELGSYWAHRLHHAYPALWWLHALHHGSERLYTLNNFRLHPLNHAINQMAGLLPLLAIGTPPDALACYLALSYPVLMLQHANLPLRSGVLNYIFSSNEVHRWHHSCDPAEGDRNFGRALVIWDLVFGTFRYRPGDNAPAAVGLYRESSYPAGAGFWQQVTSMLRPACCRAAA
jgi:sterol desaturase/sphingolipid hydroxylase (fatty acid hydroxylase superfamily)